MIKCSLTFFALAGTFLYVEAASAREPICQDFASKIEPDMQRRESDFTHENYVASQQHIEITVREWMENKFERNKGNRASKRKLFDGDIWLAHANHNATVKGYVLKLEYQIASKENEEVARQKFCKFVVETPRYD